MMVSLGNASGSVPPFVVGELASRGSLFLTRPSLMSYMATRDDLEAAAASLFGVVSSGAVKIEIKQRYKLADVAQAHSCLVSCDHIPRRSMPLFRAKAVLDELIA